MSRDLQVMNEQNVSVKSNGIPGEEIFPRDAIRFYAYAFLGRKHNVLDYKSPVQYKTELGF